MAENKRYYWLKLMDDFFDSKRIKKLRKMAGGDTYTIIYLKMQLLSLKKGGYLEYSGLEDEFYKEIALDIDEDEINVQVTIQFLLSCGLLETSDSIEYKLPFVQDNLGSETASTRRSRKSRGNAQKALQCNSDEADRNNLQQKCNVEKDIEIDTDIDKETREVPVNLSDSFEKFWNAYPKKVSRMLAEQEYVQLITDTPNLTPEQLLVAVQNYAESCSILKVKPQFIKNPSNWLRESTWIDYIAENYQKPTADTRKSSGKKPDRFNNFTQRAYDYDSLEQKMLGKV